MKVGVEVYEIAEGVDGDDGARNNVASVHSPAISHDILHFSVRVLAIIGLRRPRQ